MTLKRDDEEERVESSIFNRYFPANSDNQTNNINSMFDFLQIHNNEESNTKFIRLMCDYLCSFDLTATSGNRETNENEQSTLK